MKGVGKTSHRIVEPDAALQPGVNDLRIHDPEHLKCYYLVLFKVQLREPFLEMLIFFPFLSLLSFLAKTGT